MMMGWMCDAMKCAANHSESCGAADIMLVFPFHCASPATPTPPPTAPPGKISPSQLRALMPPHDYQGAPRLYRSAVRTTISKEDPQFRLEVTVLTKLPPTRVVMVVDTGGSDRILVMSPTVDALRGTVHSQVYHVQIATPTSSFEYHVQAECQNGLQLRAPLASNQTVVVI